jgi:hypothetical protein
MKNWYVGFTLAGGLLLFGSLFITGITDNGLWFIFGYPASVVSLMLAYRFARMPNK